MDRSSSAVLSPSQQGPSKVRWVTSPILCLQLTPSLSNWSDSSSFLATVSQNEMLSVSTQAEVPASPHHAGAVATVATMMNVSGRNHAGTFINQMAAFEKTNRSQQDQCWETYVGQVSPSVPAPIQPTTDRFTVQSI